MLRHAAGYSGCLISAVWSTAPTRVRADRAGPCVMAPRADLGARRGWRRSGQTVRGCLISLGQGGCWPVSRGYEAAQGGR